MIRNQYNKINIPAFGESVGVDIQSSFDNIDKNFDLIMNSGYMKGDRGNSIIAKSVILDENIKEELKNAIKNQPGFPSSVEKINGIDVFDYLNTDGLRIVCIYEEENGIEKQISSLPFVFKDLRFSNVNQSIGQLLDDETDWSCVLQFDESSKSYIALQTFPTLYYESEFKWKINGIKTGLTAQGPKGDPGKNGSLMLVDVERDSGGNYKIIGIYTGIEYITVSDDKSYQICKNNGLTEKTSTNPASIVMAMCIDPDNDNLLHSFIGPVFASQQIMYVQYPGKDITTLEIMTAKEIEQLCEDVWG